MCQFPLFYLLFLLFHFLFQILDEGNTPIATPFPRQTVDLYTSRKTLKGNIFPKYPSYRSSHHKEGVIQRQCLPRSQYWTCQQCVSRGLLAARTVPEPRLRGHQDADLHPALRPGNYVRRSRELSLSLFFRSNYRQSLSDTNPSLQKKKKKKKKTNICIKRRTKADVT